MYGHNRELPTAGSPLLLPKMENMDLLLGILALHHWTDTTSEDSPTSTGEELKVDLPVGIGWRRGRGSQRPPRWEFLLLESSETDKGYGRNLNVS